MIYSHKVSYKGLDGTSKERIVNFIIRKTDVVENSGVFEEYSNVVELLKRAGRGDVNLTEQQGIDIMKVLLSIIDLGYAVVDYQEDTIDKSPEALAKFKKSVVYSTLIDSIIDDSNVAMEIIGGITDSMDLSEDEKSKVESEKQKLKDAFIARTTRQNDNNHGQTLHAVPRELSELEQVRNRLAELERGE